MADIEQAYRTLGLNTGASLRQVDEAYRDLQALWDPKRLIDSPRLRAQASEKKQEIEQAYESIIEDLSQVRSQRTAPSRPFDLNSAPGTDSDAQRPSANLFDDAFSERVTQSKRKIPVWAIALLVGVASLFLAYLSLSPSRERAEAIEAVAQIEEESELAKVVNEVRGRYTVSNGTQPVVEAPEPTSQEATPLKTKSAPSPSKPIAKKVKPVQSRNAPQEPIRKKQVPAPQPPPKPEIQTERVERLDRPLLVREEVQPSDDDTPQQLEDGPSDDQLAVFKTLLKGSATASKLVKGEIGTLSFAQWSVIQQTASETWIDLVATWTSGQEVHFFWSVHPGTGGVRPLNQAARNLESSVGAP